MSASQWVILAIVCGTIEIFTLGFWFLWLSLSAILIAVSVSLGWLGSLQSQLLLFSIFTLLFLVFTRPIVMRLIKTNDTLSNADALVGQHGIVTSDIGTLSYGQVKVNGEIWTATSKEEITVGHRVEVTAIEGVKVVVQRTEE